MDSDCTGGRIAMQFDTASQNNNSGKKDKGDEMFVFDMGQPIKICDLANRIIDS